MEYHGKIYSLCSLRCKVEFMKNPEAYSKKAEKEIKNQELMAWLAKQKKTGCH